MNDKPMQIKDTKALTQCGDATLPLKQTPFVIPTDALPSLMFNPDGTVNTAMLTPFGDLGHINFLKVTEEILETTVATELIDECNPPRELEGIIELKRISIVVVCDYTIVLYNNHENHNPFNSDAILGQTWNSAIFDIEGFAFLPVGADSSKYYDKNNYDLKFMPIITLTFGTQYSDAVGVVSQGTVELIIN